MSIGSAPKQETIYKLNVRFEVSKMLRTTYNPGDPAVYQSDQYTNERLSIDDSFDLADAMTLTAVLGKIDAIHTMLRDG